MASGQGSHWLIESPTMFRDMCHSGGSTNRHYSHVPRAHEGKGPTKIAEHIFVD